MTNIIDRRKNPAGKSIDNRQRFIKRVKENLRKSVREAIKNRKITDIDSEEKVNIPIKDIREPVFRHSRTGGNKTHIHPGNKKFNEGDQIDKPTSGGGKGSGPGSSGSGTHDDEFAFTLTKEEFLDIFFEDLELPDLVKKDLKEIKAWKYQRAGYTTVGSPTNINIERSMRHSVSRRIALKRPKTEELDELIARVLILRHTDPLTLDEKKELAFLEVEIERISRKMRAVPFIDPIDIRYNLFVPQPLPNTKAVMFCIMDVSGSMTEREKDIAKRFFMLLYLFLERRYEQIELVFIKHHTEAKECTEEEFFYHRESGGTIISSALKLATEIIKKRYPTSEWNLYGAQASDGDNSTGDSTKCLEIMSDDIMPVMQYFAYIEIIPEVQSSWFSGRMSNSDRIWNNYKKLEEKYKNFAMKQIAGIKDIFPVFRELFTKKA
jgi:uncharacterized sporulation protein YeaH/YhbH (DUF444 family)